MRSIVCFLPCKALPVLAAMLLSAVALSALAETSEDRHGAIAFSQGTDGSHAWGMAWSFESQAGAAARANAECRSEGGGNCAQVGWFRNACGALAIGSGNGYGAGWGDTKQAAEADALSECRFRNDGCRAVISRCAEPEEEEEATTSFNPGEVFRDCPSCPEMVVVPAGTFVMGSPPGEEYRHSDGEGPQHRASISQPFAVGIYEVTFEEWDACVAAGGCGGYRPPDEGWGRGRRPAIHVSWNDAREYVGWLSRRTGMAYRLLSEAEWEYATRAGTTTPYYFGSSISRGQANYGWHPDSHPDNRGLRKTVPVGQYPANGFGLYDVHGNVWEWVQDCYTGSYHGAPRDGSAWISGECSTRVLRGGSWNSGPDVLRSAIRSRNDPGDRYSDLGFRVARTLTP